MHVSEVDMSGMYFTTVPFYYSFDQWDVHVSEADMCGVVCVCVCVCDRNVLPTELISVKDVAQVISLIASGELTDKLARQVVEGVIAGEGNPADVINKRGLKVVSDDGALMKAIEDAIAAQPETAERVRGGNVPAAGALIGAVMKATGGQADAAKVRELLLKHLGQ